MKPKIPRGKYFQQVWGFASKNTMREGKRSMQVPLGGEICNALCSPGVG